MEHVAIIDGQHHTVDAIEPVPGLRVYKHPHRDYGIGTYPVCLGHHEGRRIARTECTADAIDAARDLAEMADWTQAETEIQAAPGLAEKVADYFAGHNAIWAGGYR